MSGGSEIIKADQKIGRKTAKQRAVATAMWERKRTEKIEFVD